MIPQETQTLFDFLLSRPSPMFGPKRLKRPVLVLVVNKQRSEVPMTER